MQEEYWLLCCK